MGAEVIGIDLGGTAIKLGRFTVDGTCVKSLTVATPQPATPEAVIVTMVDAIAQLDPLNQAIAIGVGTPGPADATRRIAKLAINLPGWVDVPLAQALEAKIGKPTIIDNDANCAGLGEAWLGSGRHFQNFILLTLGTGVGGAIFFDGKLFAGHYGAAGELGLITFNPDGHVSLRLILLRFCLLFLSLGQDIGYIAGFALTSFTISALFLILLFGYRYFKRTFHFNYLFNILNLYRHVWNQLLL